MRLCHCLLLILCASTLAAQQSSTAGAPDTSAFRRLELPTANSIRTGSGAPGPDYWQQRVDYVIRATLDTVDRAGSRRGADHLHQQLPRHPAVSLAAAGPEPVQQREPGRRGCSTSGAAFGTGGAEGGVRILKVGEPAVAASRGRPARPAVPLCPIW